MQRPVARALVAITVGVVAVAVGGCDVFGIRCNADADCPTDVPFCNIGVCSTVDGPVRAEGEGEDANEGEGEDAGCGADSDCAADNNGLCYDLEDGDLHFEARFVGTCVPDAADEGACGSALLSIGGPSRPPSGPAIFGVTATRAGGDCGAGTQSLNIEILYLDREGDYSGSGGFSVMPQNGSSPTFGTGSVSGDGTSGEVFAFLSACIPDSDTVVGVALGQTSPESNAICVPISG